MIELVVKHGTFNSSKIVLWVAEKSVLFIFYIKTECPELVITY